MPLTSPDIPSNQPCAHASRPLAALLWGLTSVLVGLLCGAGGVLLSEVCELAQEANGAFLPLAYALPVCALASYALYQGLGIDHGFTSATVFSCARANEAISAKLAPAILLGTALTLLGSGSVGKEAAALQLGGALAAQVGLLDSHSGRTVRQANLARILSDIAAARGTFTLAGMAAAFSALLFTPVAATLVVLEVAKLARHDLLRWRTLCIPIASFVAWRLAELFGVGRLWDSWRGFAAIDSSGIDIASILFLCAACLAVGACFVWLLKSLRVFASRRVSRPWLRMLIGALLAMGFAAIFGRSYCGTGSTQITQALAGGSLDAWAFAAKALLTLCCLGWGLKGGEVMPALCIGACLGSAVAAVCGADPATFAALGMVGVFSACSLSPLASLALGVEAFGAGLAPCIAVAALLPGLAATALDMARLCRRPGDVHRYLRDPHAPTLQHDKFSLGLFA